LITTTPSVEYKIALNTKDAAKVPELTTSFRDEEGYYHIHTAAEFPDKVFIKEVQEPWVNLEIITPELYIGPIMDLCQKNRGEYKSMEFVSSELINGSKQAILNYDIPVAEIITNFFDKLKSVSQGYGSMDYTMNCYRVSDIEKVNIIINDELVEALSFLTHSSNSETKGRKLVTRLAELIPRQQIPIPIQASIGFKVFARETVRAYRKDVIAKMSGGDVSRKIKLLEKQKKGKKKAKEKMIGKINVPQEVFLKALKLD
jgi:GTP-binding protein LepA